MNNITYKNISLNKYYNRMEMKFKKRIVDRQPKQEKTKVEYVSLSSNADEEYEKKYSKRGKMNFLVLGSFISMIIFCLVVYFVFYSKPIKSIIALSILVICLYFFFKGMKKDYYKKTVETITNIKSLIKQKVYKEDEKVEDRLYYSMNI